jgi:hypothetical protein
MISFNRGIAMINTRINVEKAIANVTAIMAIEGFELTDQDFENMRRIATGEATDDEVVADIIERYKRSGVIQ